MTVPRTSLCVFAWAGLISTSAQADDTQLAPVHSIGMPAPASGPDPQGGFTASSVPARALPILGGPAQTNPYKAIELMPSVNLSGTDAYGLSVEQNFLRIRGISAYTFSNLALTVNGAPSSVNVGNGGMGNLWDLENIAGVSLIRGPVPADQGLGFGNLAGAMNLTLRAPAQTFGASGRAAFGSEHFHKVFARVDSGESAAGTRFFVSVSDTAADKWRGPGEQGRQNIAVGIAQSLGTQGSLELYATHNRFDRHEYRPLTYAQSRDLGTYGSLDYNPVLVGNAARDALYFDFNRQQFEEDAIFAVLSWRLGADTLARLKPYWQKTSGYRLTNSGSNLMRMDIDQDQSGLVAELETRVLGQALGAGWWTQRIETIPPPLSQKVYAIGSGGQPVFTRWAILAEMPQRNYDSPYLTLSGGTGDFRYKAGVRHLRFSLPGITSHVAAGIGDIDRDAALALNPPVNPALSTGATRLQAVLPSASLQWRLGANLEARVAAGRTVGNPWLGPLYSTYLNNPQRFQAAGVSLQSLWNSLRLEKGDTIDLGLNWRHGNLSLAPTLFHTRFKDKQVTAYDPAVGVSYLQSGVAAHAYGAELEAVWAAGTDLELVGSLSWNTNLLDDDIRSGAGSVIASDGKQVPDTPRWLAKLGANYQAGGWQLSPVLRYVGKRYGDALNTEPVAAYTLADLNARYRIGRQGEHRPWLELGVSVLNAFDRHYVSTINVGQDDARPGTTTYYPGAPRTWVFSVAGHF